jgi:hypothetical protein
MKVLSVGLARVFLVFDISEINPTGKDIYVHLLPALLDDYKFKTSPKPGEDLSQGMKLTGGEFVKEDGTVLNVNVTIYSDGIAADTFSSTKDSEEFLATALSELPDAGFVWEPSMIRRKMYLSQLNVKCSASLDFLNPELSVIAKKLSEMCGAVFGVAAFELWPDQTQKINPANFSFQRKVGEPLDTDRFWSQAALPTEQHVELLTSLEVALSGRK